MSKKSVANAPSQTETEYFVSFFETEYPKCRSGVRYCVVDGSSEDSSNSRLDYNDEIIKMQRQDKQNCFCSCCEKDKCNGKDPNCYWKCKRDSHDTIISPELLPSDCLRLPFICATNPCPEAVQQTRYCVSIGLLTSEELEAFVAVAVELKDKKYKYGYLLQSKENIGKVPLEAIARYSSAVKKLEKRSAPHLSKDENSINVLKRYEEYADSIRAVRESSQPSVVKPLSNVSKSVNTTKIKRKPFNAERDACLYELWEEHRYYPKVCDEISKDKKFMDDVPDEKAAREAVLRHCERNNLEYPPGKPGRRSL